MRDNVSNIIRYYLFGRPRVTIAAIAIVALMFAVPNLTKEQKHTPSLAELQAQIKSQIDNASSGITLQEQFASKEIHKAEVTIANMDACLEANQGLRKFNASITMESFTKGVQPKKAIDCRGFKIESGSGTVVTKPQASAPLPAKPVAHTPLKPDDLFLTTSVKDKCAISQGPAQHFIANKRFAYDVACTFNTGKAQPFIAYVPDYLDTPYKYTISKKYTDNLTGNTLELSFTGKNNSPMKWVIGHITSRHKPGDILVTGQVLGQSDLSGLTTGYHNHIELWMNGVNIDYTTRSQVIENKRYNNLQAWNWGDKIYFTHYTLGDVNQNDKTPCIGASGVNSCDLLRNGIKSVAITVDVRKSLGIKFGDTIEIAGPCGGQYQVHDEKGERFRYSCIKGEGYCKKGDIATQIGRRDSNGKLIIDYDGIPGCKGGVHTLVRKINT